MEGDGRQGEGQGPGKRVGEACIGDVEHVEWEAKACAWKRREERDVRCMQGTNGGDQEGRLGVRAVRF